MKRQSLSPGRTAPLDVLLAQTVLELTDVLVDEFDVIDVLTSLADRSVELFDVAAVGILLVDEKEHLRVVAASSEEIRLLELFQLQNDEGPCLDCYRTGEDVIVADLASDGRWPVFTKEAIRSSFGSVLAVPLRLRKTTLGAMNLFQRGGSQVSDETVPVIHALAAIACVTILQDQATSKAEALVVELRHALDSRVAIEQAKGMIAEHQRSSHADMDGAFRSLRSYARSNNRLLTEVARDVVTGELDLNALKAP